MKAPGQIAILALVGPGQAEKERLHRMLQSVFFHEPNILQFVLIDDTLTASPPNEGLLVPPGKTITVLKHERAGKHPAVLGGMCMGVLQGLKHLAQICPEVEAVMKMDTDALVIRPFVEKARALMEANPTLGTAGLVDSNCDGTPREWQPFSDMTFHLAKIFRVQRFPLLKRRIVLWGRWNVLRKLVRRARANGYRWGEHAQGGSYLVSAKLIQCMAERDYLDQGPLWHDVYMAEDAMMGLYSRACGLQNIPFAGEGEMFGCSFQGLPFPPEELLRRGYSIIHSVKNNGYLDEPALQDFFLKPPA